MRIVSADEGWTFFRDAKNIEELPSLEGVAVNLPHTWNNLDGQDGGNDYYRGTCYYSKVVDINKKAEKEYYLEFRGVNSIATVYVNGENIGEHRGGFSTFRYNVTSAIHNGINTVVVAVSNSDNDFVYPRIADFTFYGGIYRDVYFIEANSTRFDLDYYGSDGVMITPTLNADKTASVTVESYVTNPLSGQNIAIDIVFDGKIVASNVSPIEDTKVTLSIEKPMLWDGVDKPYLYTANIRIMDGDEVVDSREIAFGIRTFAVDKDGFYLNGRRYALHGVSRHQDRLNKGWAISKEEHDTDMNLIREMGATSIRLAHYQHDQYFYDLCDRYGMVVWAEIPYISVHLENGDDNAIDQMRELVIQNYNHPSIMFWGLSNEITIGGESESQLELHKRLNALVKSLDTTRLTAMANVTMCSTRSPLLQVPDVFGYNHYFGWYVGDVEDNEKWLDNFRTEFPLTPIALTEYGCEAVLDYHNSTPRQGDYSEEYQAYYHENMLRIFEERPYLFATYVWNMFDFGVDSRDEGGVKGRNNKGLVTYDRQTKKDSFYLYKAYWSREPFVHICSKRYKKRAEESTSIKVYTNQDKVDIYVNDKLLTTKTGTHIYEFTVPLSLTGTRVKVIANGYSDEAKFRRVLKACDDYVLKEDRTKVHNWFEENGERYEFEYPEGKFSIRDTLNDIMATREGAVLIKNLMMKATEHMTNKGSDASFFDNMIGLVGGMSIEKIAGFAKIDEKTLYEINVELNKISK